MADSVALDFPIHETYDSYTQQSKHSPWRSPIPPPLAAIATLTDSIEAHPLHTISETLTLLADESKKLQQTQRHRIAVGAGADLFQRYLTMTIARPSSTNYLLQPAATGPESVKKRAISEGRALVQRGLDARRRIANHSVKGFIRDGCTLVLPVYDVLVEDILRKVADAHVDVRLVFVEAKEKVGFGALKGLFGGEGQGVAPVRVRKEALAHTLSMLRPEGEYAGPVRVLVGAEAILPSGGVLAPVGTLQAAALAKHFGIEVWVAAESFKGCRWFPADKNEVLQGVGLGEDGSPVFDVTPSSLITTFLTEHGPRPPAALAEDLVKAWF